VRGWNADETSASRFRYLPDGKRLLIWGMAEPRLISLDSYKVVR
jgi:hypothetical protein